MNGLALCAGAGGLELGLRLAIGSSYRTVGYVERDCYAASVLVARMEDEVLDLAPVADDLTAFDGHPWRGLVDIVSGGFPCQPWSMAGKGLGTEDERWIWPGIVRIIREVGPGYVFLENVPGLVARDGLGHVLGDLAALGFDAEWLCHSAEAEGAPHERERLWILAAHAERIGGRGESEPVSQRSGETDAHADGAPRAVADAASERRGEARRVRPGEPSGRAASSGEAALADASRLGRSEGRPEPAGLEGQGLRRHEPRESGWWSAEPDVGRTLDGLAAWMDGGGSVVTHKLFLAYVTSSQARSGEDVRALRSVLEQEALRRPAGRPERVSPEGVLLAYVRQLEARASNEARVQLARSETSQVCVRGVQPGDQLDSAPPRPACIEQRPVQHPDALQALSRLLARHAETAWAAYSRTHAPSLLTPWGPGWEDGFSRVSSAVPHWADRLRLTGNGVVPAVAARAFRELWRRIHGGR